MVVGYHVIRVSGYHGIYSIMVVGYHVIGVSGV